MRGFIITIVVACCSFIYGYYTYPAVNVSGIQGGAIGPLIRDTVIIHDTAKAPPDIYARQDSLIKIETEKTDSAFDYWVKAHEMCDRGNRDWAENRKTKARKEFDSAKKLWNKFEISGGIKK